MFPDIIDKFEIALDYKSYLEFTLAKFSREGKKLDILKMNGQLVAVADDRSEVQRHRCRR